MSGLVSLVGAGPGDPELLTVRAVQRLQEADLVLYDALVDRAALRHAPQARWAYVGKRAGRRQYLRALSAAAFGRRLVPSGEDFAKPSAVQPRLPERRK